MVSHNPSFSDITWGAGGSTADLTLEIANRMQNMVCVETMMHLTCTNMPVDHALEMGYKMFLLFVVIHLMVKISLFKLKVKHMRAKYGDYFGITVAEAHPDVIPANGLATPEAYENDLAYLKKVDAGADLIVTQLFYDTDNFLKFVNDCRQIRITCPIVPGIMPINNYKGFLRMTGFCKTKIPAEITAALEPIKDNEEAVKAYRIHLGTEMCKKIMASGIKTLHLYTLNMEKSALAILMNLGLIEESKISRSLPWRRPTNVFRVKEDVRPIFWVNRPKSYISRTIGWDEYPHGQWGNAQNPSYGALSDYQLMRARSRDKKLQEEWAIALNSVEDIYEVWRNLQIWFSPKETQSSIQIGTWMHEKKIRDQRLLKRAKLISTPSKALLFRSFQMIHIKARGATFQALCRLLLAPLFQETPTHAITFRFLRFSAVKIIPLVQNSYFLVDNDYINGDLFAIFKDI
ncbi:hypothetical protein K7X08_030195 [Anisodus acutangulus]|uniref:Methylenetetrahydrofolate reductase n=1 Tax=Anisodus acutangulus TaxID=402998 RepID=A0A9Q1LMA7_9SOLA|nr:hypothetical protein K7X08_030195 [Anisodus acutangulus]